MTVPSAELAVEGRKLGLAYGSLLGAWETG